MTFLSFSSSASFSHLCSLPFVNSLLAYGRWVIAGLLVGFVF